MYDGCCSISEMIERLQDQMGKLQDLQGKGWQIESQVHDDYATLIPENLQQKITEIIAFGGLDN